MQRDHKLLLSNTCYDIKTSNKLIYPITLSMIRDKDKGEGKKKKKACWWLVGEWERERERFDGKIFLLGNNGLLFYVKKKRE